MRHHRVQNTGIGDIGTIEAEFGNQLLLGAQQLPGRYPMTFGSIPACRIIASVLREVPQAGL
jgi:hypothetical protein